MIKREINGIELREAIRVAFNMDDNIYKLYCPCVKVETLNDIVRDISSRLHNDEPDAELRGVYEKGEIIGYYVFDGTRLISFALNKKYRDKRRLRKYFDLIRDELGDEFECYLWSINERGVRWLVKNGMRIIDVNPLITKLKM